MNYQPDFIFATLKMIAALFIVMGGIFFILFLIKKQTNKSSGMKGTNLIKILASRYIGVKKTITLVEVPGSILVLGITNERVSLLDKIDCKETLMQVQQAKQTDFTTVFSERISKIRSNFGREKE